MTEKYVVLQYRGQMTPSIENLGFESVAAVGAAIPSALGGIRGALLDEESLVVHEAELTKAEHHDLRRDPQTYAMAPLMPMKLIEPVTMKGAAVPTNVTVTWGVKAVSAAGSV